MKSILLNFRVFRLSDFFPFIKEGESLAVRLNVAEALMSERDIRRVRFFDLILKITHILYIPSLLGLLYGSMFQYVGVYKMYGYSVLVAMALFYLLSVFIFFSLKYQSVVGEFHRVRNPQLSVITYSLLTAFLGKFFPFIGVMINLYLLNKVRTLNQRRVVVVMLILSLIWSYKFFTTYF